MVPWFCYSLHFAKLSNCYHWPVGKIFVALLIQCYCVNFVLLRDGHLSKRIVHLDSGWCHLWWCTLYFFLDLYNWWMSLCCCFSMDDTASWCSICGFQSACWACNNSFNVALMVWLAQIWKWRIHMFQLHSRVQCQTNRISRPKKKEIEKKDALSAMTASKRLARVYCSKWYSELLSILLQSIKLRTILGSFS